MLGTDILLKAGADVNIVGLKRTILLVASERDFHCGMLGFRSLFRVQSCVR